jgi:uncharacterized protein involved in exopolysaccharide biosynthesis
MTNRTPSGSPHRNGVGNGHTSTDVEPGEPFAPSLRDWARYALNALEGRWLLVSAIFLLGLGATTLYYVTRTPMYRVETKVLAQRQQALPSIARSAVPDDAPTRTAYEIVHRRENLVSLLRQTNLVPPPGSEPAGSRWSRWVGRLTAASSDGPDAEDEALNQMVLQLDKELVVTTGDGTITISLDWPNAEDAYNIVEAALQNFLEARQVQEITAIDDAIRLLQERVVTARANLDKVTAEAQQGAVREVVEQAAPGRTTPLPPPTASQELQVLSATLEAKERSLRDIEDLRRRRLVELQSQLDERRGVYSESHPAIAALRKEIDAMSRESPQVTTLREEVAILRDEYTTRLAEETRGRSGSARAGAPRTVRIVPSPSGVEDQRVRDARVQYEQMVNRVNAAQTDLDAARAAFKYRYTVTWPARVPRKPVSPNPVRIFGAGILASMLLAMGVAIRPLILEGRIRERWQVEHSLGLPLLADLIRK